MQQRSQQTIRRCVETSGIGFLTGANVTLRFIPAPANYGIAFQRIDCDGTEPIPARIEHVVSRQRRTAIEYQGVTVEMIEHVLAALAGLRVDNCLVQLDAPEPPGFDGSSQIVADCLLEAGIIEQDELRPVLFVEDDLRVSGDADDCEILAKPLARPILAIGYHLDYGARSPIPPQHLTVEITPATFIDELAFARTFILESEIDSLRARGYGQRTTTKDLLVFAADGLIDNRLRTPDECVRHKILDCLGDFALIGCDLCGCFSAFRSGHRLNHDVVRQLRQSHLNSLIESARLGENPRQQDNQIDSQLQPQQVLITEKAH